MDIPEDQKSVADLAAEKQTEDRVPHRPGCRMPGCEGECWTGTGYSPAEVRAMTEDRVPTRKMNGQCAFCRSFGVHLDGCPALQPESVPLHDSRCPVYDDEDALCSCHVIRFALGEAAPSLDVERLARAMEICGVGFYHATEPRMLLEQSLSAIAAEYERLARDD